MIWNEKIRRISLIAPGWWLLLIIIGALALRINYANTHPLETRDGIQYMEFCREWFEKADAALPYEMQGKPLLYQYTVRSLMFLNISVEEAALGLNLFVGALLLLPVYFSGKVLFEDSKAALGIVLLAAVMPPLVEYSAVRLRETFYFFFTAWSICFWLFSINGSKHRQIWTAFCGAAVCLATMCRFEGGELAIFCGVSLPVSEFFRRSGWMRSIFAGGLFAGGFAICALLLFLLPGMPNFILIYLQQFRVI